MLHSEAEAKLQQAQRSIEEVKSDPRCPQDLKKELEVMVFDLEQMIDAVGNDRYWLIGPRRA